MRSLFRPSKIVGLDIGSRYIKAVALSSGMKGARVESLARVSIAPERAGHAARTVADGLTELGALGFFPAEWVTVSLPGDQVTVRSFDLPRLPKQGGDSLVKYEMESLLPYLAENIVVDFLKRPSAEEGKTQILGVAAQKSDIGALMEQITASGVEPRSLGWSGLGAYLALSESPAMPVGGRGLLLDMGAERSAITIFDDEGPLLVRSVGIGGEALTENLARALDISFEQAESLKLREGLDIQGEEKARAALRDALIDLIREVEVSRLAVGADLDEILITGGGSQIKGATQFFQEALGVECERFDILKHLPTRAPVAETDHGAEYTAAAGLALAALNSSKYGLNFLKEEFATRHPLDMARGKLRAAAVIAGIAICLFGVNFYLDLKYKEQRYETLNQQVRKVFTATFPDARNIVNEESQLNAAIDDAKKGVASLATGGATGMTLEILKSISAQTPPESDIRVTELSMGEREIMIVGEAPSFESVNQFRDRLDDLQELDQVTVEGANANEFNKKIDFSIKMVRRNP